MIDFYEASQKHWEYQLLRPYLQFQCPQTEDLLLLFLLSLLCWHLTRNGARQIRIPLHDALGGCSQSWPQKR